MRRMVFPVLFLFWITMSFLLWRAEYGDAGRGSKVSLAVVIEKIFNAPDASSLQVYNNKQSIGFIRWEIIPDEIYFRGTNQPVGRVESIDGYTLSVDGRLQLEPLQSKLRFTLRSGLDSELNSQNLYATIDSGESIWNIQSNITNQVLTVKHDGSLGKWERSVSFDQLSNPFEIVNQFAGPTILPLIQKILPEKFDSIHKESINEIETFSKKIGLNWEAYNDFLRLGSTRVRIYRLEAKLPGEQSIIIRISRVGEILQVEFPGQFVINNESIPLRKTKIP